MTQRVDLRPQREALYQYAKAHDHFAELEQLEEHQGHHALAAGARRFAELVVRAWLAERDDPEPRQDA